MAQSGEVKKTFFSISIYLGSKNLVNGPKAPLNLFLWGCMQKFSMLPPSSGSLAPNFQKFAITFDSDIAET